jgi:hypothetical protein
MSSYRPRLGNSPYPSSDGWQHAAAASAPRSYHTGLARPMPGQPLNGSLKTLAWIVGAVFITNLMTHLIFNPAAIPRQPTTPVVDSPLDKVPGETLYLMEKAGLYVPDIDAFEAKVREISAMLEVPPEWLMAVMYSESKFDASVKNYKGSGATGLIQFMPAAASEMKVSLQRLERMDPVHQLEYVYLYLQTVRDRYGDFNSLTELYLGILYPKAIGQDYCYSLYAHPTKSYQQNAGLDENKDRHVTVSDIDHRMKRLYPTAYMIDKNPGSVEGMLSLK